MNLNPISVDLREDTEYILPIVGTRPVEVALNFTRAASHLDVQNSLLLTRLQLGDVLTKFLLYAQTI